MFTSPTSHIVAALWALSLAALIQGEGHPFPAPTPVDQQPPALVAWSPRTTEVPRIRGRAPFPTIFARQASLPLSFCGYVNADKNKPLTCPDPSLCLSDTIYYDVDLDFYPNSFTEPKDCWQHTSCVPKTGTCDENCMTNDDILKCSQLSAPNCYTYEWPQLYKRYGCSTSSFWSSVEFTYNGEPIPPSMTCTGTSSSSSSTSGTSTTSMNTTFTIPPIPAIILPSSSKSSINTGAIAGGVVGGVAVIVAFVLGLLFLRRKRNNSSTPLPAPMFEEPNSRRGAAFMSWWVPK